MLECKKDFELCCCVWALRGLWYWTVCSARPLDPVLHQEHPLRPPIGSPQSMLLSGRSQFASSVSDPILNQLLDQLLEQGIINQEEMESARTRTRADKARAVIDMVQNKGTRASSFLIEVFRTLDPHLSETLQWSWSRNETLGDLVAQKNRCLKLYSLNGDTCRINDYCVALWLYNQVNKSTLSHLFDPYFHLQLLHSVPVRLQLINIFKIKWNMWSDYWIKMDALPFIYLLPWWLTVSLPWWLSVADDWTNCDQLLWRWKVRV